MFPNIQLIILRICQQCYNLSGDTSLTVLNVKLRNNCSHGLFHKLSFPHTEFSL